MWYGYYPYTSYTWTHPYWGYPTWGVGGYPAAWPYYWYRPAYWPWLP
jgi:hypothetical protein